jgi:hypothetical protein
MNLQTIPNANRTWGELHFYQYAPLIITDKEGNTELLHCLFTETELRKAHERAEENPDLVPQKALSMGANGSWWQFWR